METQKIALFGATTQQGRCILNEALDRGHKVTAFVTDPKKVNIMHPNLKVETADSTNKNDIAGKIKGHDVVISTYHIKSSPQDHLSSTRSILAAAKSSGIKRLVSVGHPGTAEIESASSEPVNPEAWQQIGQVQNDVLKTFEGEKDLHWSYVHYPEIQDAAQKKSKPTVGNEMLVKSVDGEHWFEAEKYAKNILDEAENLLEHHSEDEEL